MLGGIGAFVSGALVGAGVVGGVVVSGVPEGTTGGVTDDGALVTEASGAAFVAGVVSPAAVVWLFMTMVTGGWFVVLSVAGADGVVPVTLLVAGGVADATLVSGADGTGVVDAAGPLAGAEKLLLGGCVTSGPGTFKLASSARS